MRSTSGSFSSSRPPRFIGQDRRRLLFVASAALLAAASLSGKALTYGAATDVRSGQSEERRIAGFLTGRGWVRTGSAELFDGGIAALDFQVPGCNGLVRVGLLPANGEMTSLFAQAMGPDKRVFYAYRGRVSGAPPRFAYLHAKIVRVTASFGFALHPDRSIVAVSQPRKCQLEAALDWSEL